MGLHVIIRLARKKNQYARYISKLFTFQSHFYRKSIINSFAKNLAEHK